MDKNSPIGFFDSGLGGISVLRESVKLLPNENYIYFGDSANAPYGIRPVSEVRRLCEKGADLLISRGVKAIVIACNTATSAGVDFLRSKYPDTPIIGVEPALKPAAEHFPNGRILVMATKMTLKEEKFLSLWAHYGKDADIIPVPCPGLMEYVEKGIFSGDDLNSYLHNKLDEHITKPINAVVLGCTHYPFLKNAISSIVGDSVEIIDGGEGTSRQLMRRLKQKDLLNTSHCVGTVTFINSSADENLFVLSQKLLKIDK